ncbi:MAG: SURF1 family protein [Rhodoferax sp.]|nr:SURF1 family protein [Rhodoferax sp.]MBP9685671.1 SURF1 family protein [Rhodoferax sp.]
MNARFRFLLITLAALLAFAVALALGFWQLSRASQKEAWQAHIDQQAAAPRLDGPALAMLPDPVLEMHRGVLLRGRWLPAHTVFLDNRPMNGKTGLYVATPLQLEGSSAVVLVLRGWVARNFVDRARLPALQTSAEVVEIQGRIAPAPSKLYELGDADAGPIRQNLDIVRVKAETGLPLLAVWVQQTDAASEGLLRDWPPANLGVHKNYGYAFQWFGLGALIAVLYVWFQIVRRFFYPRRA